MSVDHVALYAKSVISGKEIAGPLVRLACERHERDRKEGPKRGLKWDLAAANRAIDFFEECLKLAGGEFEGKPFILHESQKFIVGSLFGWKSSDGFRRFRMAYNEIGKGNGKSPLAAGIGLYMLVADKESRAEIYAAACDKDQAKILYRDAIAMVDQSSQLNARLVRSGGPGKEWNLAYLKTGSFFRPISSETVGRGKSGPRPHCGILDEVHEHPSNAMVEFLRAGTKGRRQALIFMITNSGVYDPTSVCWNYHEYAEKILRQQFEDDSFFCFVCGLDKDDSWLDEKVWKKANPLLGVSITEKYLREQVHMAEGMPSKQSLIRRLNFCEWVESSDPFVDPEIWKANGRTFDRAELLGKKCYGGLDLSGKNDLASLKLVFPLDDGTKAVLPFFWTPGDTLRRRQEKDRAPYDAWVRDGLLIAKPGATIDFGWIAAEIGELSKLYDIQCIGFDRYRIEDLQRELDDIGVNVLLVEHGQGYKDMDPAIEVLEDDLKENRLRHGNNPILSWCVANVRVITDPAGLRKFDKRKATGRIDGAVALAMADRMSARDDNRDPQFFVIGS